eukprot:scaffold133532_cov26-Tisochrysis_lutea.AAC.6
MRAHRDSLGRLGAQPGVCAGHSQQCRLRVVHQPLSQPTAGLLQLRRGVRREDGVESRLQRTREVRRCRNASTQVADRLGAHCNCGCAPSVGRGRSAAAGRRTNDESTERIDEWRLLQVEAVAQLAQLRLARSLHRWLAVT